MNRCVVLLACFIVSSKVPERRFSAIPTKVSVVLFIPSVSLFVSLLVSLFVSLVSTREVTIIRVLIFTCSSDSCRIVAIFRFALMSPVSLFYHYNDPFVVVT